ncbi:MAG: DUF4347 domain-containing protein, partial [Chloroflexi bacterium]|nr:DUF4347 domain-containing protein [Chloroflexota bacterium]
AIHFITHGSDGAVQLGGTWLDARALAANSEAVAKWGDSLKADADILFYGCDLTETARGRALVDWIAELTRADVAASEDATGSARLGGDWDLEYRTGEIDTPVVVSLPAQGEWDHLLATFTVTQATDTNPGGGGAVGELRWAITQANAAAGADTIEFSIGAVGSVQTITLQDGPDGGSTADLLPSITGTVTINGWSQGGGGYTGPPLIVINGNDAPGAGLTLTGTADGSAIRGLVVRNFGGDGVWIQSGSDDNVVIGNYIGRLNPSGTPAVAGEQNFGDGLQIDGARNVIGGLATADRNVISGNSGDGIKIGSTGTANQILGNYIGTEGGGTAALGNSFVGVNVLGGGNTIGGTTINER